MKKALTKTNNEWEELEHWITELRDEVKDFCPYCGIKPKMFSETIKRKLSSERQRLKEGIEEMNGKQIGDEISSYAADHKMLYGYKTALSDILKLLE